MADFLFWLIIGYGLRYSLELITGKIENMEVLENDKD
nr:MAG TPA: hypothetical protein [Caudoviricetes sp.]